MLRVNVKFVNRGDFTLRTNAALDLAYITTTDGRKHFFDIASNTELYSGVVVAPGQSSVAVLDRMKVPKTFVLKNIKRISVFLHDNGLWFTGVLQPEHFQPLIRS